MTKPSIKLSVKKGVTVLRDGKRVRPEIGKDFAFTAEERDSILSADAGALGEATGKDGDAAEAGAPVVSSAEQSQAKASNGRKKATAGKSDAENAEDGDGNAPDKTTPKKEGEGESSAADETAADQDDDL